jgi:curved DNA-binding protein
MRAGKQLRLRGMGEAGRAGGEAGDLYVTIHIRNLLIQKVKDIIAAIWSHVRSG